MKDANFTGKTIWSAWYGSSEEDRAVFVDEQRCIGCLNCAVVARSTFAIETRFGKARAIWQWGNDEETQQAAIDSCPVNCIKWNRIRLKMKFLHNSVHLLQVGGSSEVACSRVHHVHHAEKHCFAWRWVQNKRERFWRSRQVLEEQGDQRNGKPSDTACHPLYFVVLLGFWKKRFDLQPSGQWSTAAETIRAKSGHWWQMGFSSSQDDAIWHGIHQSQGAIVPAAYFAPQSSFFASAVPEELRFLHEAAQKRHAEGNVLFSVLLFMELFSFLDLGSQLLNIHSLRSQLKSTGGHSQLEVAL